MGRSIEVVDGRIVSRRVGSVDWQDAMDSFGMYSALVEDTGARELLMNMGDADVQIPAGDARDLADMFLKSTPDSLAVAVIKPANETGAHFLANFIEYLSAKGRRIAAVESEPRAERFFQAAENGAGQQAVSPRPAGGPGSVASLLARLFGRRAGGA